MTDSRWRRIGASGGIVFVALQMAAQGLLQTGQSEPAFSAPAEDIVSYFASKSSLLGEVSAFVIGLSLIAFVWFLGSLWAKLREAEGDPAWLALTAALSGVMAIAAVYASPGWHLALFRIGDGLDPQIARLLFDSGNLGFANMWVLLASMLLACGAVTLRTGALARWTGWAGIVIAAGLLAARAFWAATGIVFLPYVLFWVWLVAVSIALMRKSGRNLDTQRRGSTAQSGG